jgi:hypothetical protein
MKRIAILILLAAFASTGCRSNCGERQGLFSRFRNKDHDDAKPAAPANCDCPPGGVPLAKGGTSFGNPAIGFPTGNTGTPIYTGPSFPTYPAGEPLPAPFPTTQPRVDELPPPGGYIPSPGVPSTPYAVPRSIESSKSAPKAGGMTTGAK